VNITTISISINEKAEQTSVETTIWNLNQYRSSNFRTSNISRASNLDSTREEFMKAKKCFNCGESSHLNRDCSKLKKLRIVRILPFCSSFIKVRG
jgi:hypothetical protein